MKKSKDSPPGALDGEAAADPPEIEEAAPEASFPVVGVGASAGGLEAFTRLLQHLPANTGMAFVFIQHLAPQHVSMLASLLSRTNAMPVIEAAHGTPVQPNHIYVIPPNTRMTIAHGILELEPRPEERGAPRPIDRFFRSLAIDRKAGGIGVVLSGADSDGALGLQAIRAEGGIAIVQSESSAKHPDMPRNAVAAGAVDMILAPEEIAEELARIANHPSLAKRKLEVADRKDHPDEAHLATIFSLLRSATGVDFRGYKPGTLRRRIARRMVLQRQDGLEAYARQLETNRPELLALYEDILINVTGFFRDAGTFLGLRELIVPQILKHHADSPVRVWVPGCSTGEEVYSIAMCLVEAISKQQAPASVQIFGTDLSERAITAARNAIYPESQVNKLAPELLHRYFTRVENGYQIVKSVREMCVFARQNVCTDPPFSRLDLISCRNVLIYLGPAFQRQVVATFHYALLPDGYLMLGHSESLREFPDVFLPIKKQATLFRKVAGQAGASLAMVSRGFAAEQAALGVLPPPMGGQRPPDGAIARSAERMVLSTYSPAWIVVNNSLEILHLQGDLAPYLELPRGTPTFELLKMARPRVRKELQTLLTKAMADDAPVYTAELRERANGRTGNLRLEVRRLPADAAEGRCFVILFVAAGGKASEKPSPAQKTLPKSAGGAKLKDVERLRDELAVAKVHLDSVIEERDATNQDLSSAIEEIRSSNEELQSINEELETSKEELQASNEELNTLNGELQSRNQELNRLSDDLANLLGSTSIPVLMLDNDLRIRRFTATAEPIFNVQDGDIGRPIGAIRTRLNIDDLEPVVRRVVDTLKAEEVELRDREGVWYVLRVRPYRTAQNRIEGAVLSLIDIDQIRRARMAATAAREFAEAVIESVHTPLLVLRTGLRVRTANRAFLEFYGVQLSEIEDRSIYEVAGNQWDLPGLRAGMERLISRQEPIQDLELEQQAPGSGTRVVLLNARTVQPDGDRQILVAVEDITARKQARTIMADEQERLKHSVRIGAEELEKTEAALFRSREELRALAASLLSTQEDERRRVSRELHDDLSQKMAKLQFDVETLAQQLPPGPAGGKGRLLAIRDGVGVLSNDLRRIAYQLHPSTLDHLGLAVALRSYSQEFAGREGVPVEFTARKVPGKIPPQVASVLFRVVQEALRNVAKHAGKTSVAIGLTGSPGRLSLSIQDQGSGFDMQSVQGAGGLGLVSMQERVRLVNGDFSLETLPGRGVSIAIRVPLENSEAS